MTNERMVKQKSGVAAILAPSGSVQARELYRLMCELAPNDVVRLNADVDGKTPVVMDHNGIFWGGMPLHESRGVYVDGWTYENPVRPSVVCGTGKADYSLWQCRHVLDQQRWSFLYSILTRLVALGVPVVNPPALHLEAFMRTVLMERLRRCGFRVPSLITTNDGESAGAFAERYGRVVWRTVTGSCAWQLFTDRQLRHLCTPFRPPVLLAQVVEGPVLRAWMVGYQPVLIVESAPPACRPIERFEVFRSVDYEHKDSMVRLSKVLDSGFVEIFFVAGESGPVIYDVNPAPCLDALPQEYVSYLNTYLAHYILGLSPVDTPPPSGILERPMPFLRRMLNMQFEIESTKYRDSSCECSETGQ